MHENQSVAKLLKTVEELLSKNMYSLASNAIKKGIQANPNAKELQFLQAKVASDSRDF